MTATAPAKRLITLELRALTIGYKPSRKKTTIVARDISATLCAGELVCLLGPNGAGKSTLMRTIAGMQQPLGGAVLLDGTAIHQLPARDLAKRLSVVLTERISIGAMTAYSLVALGRYPHTNWAGTLNDKDHEAIQWALRTTGADEFAARQIGELSDGERQRVMVARALAQEPQLMILDEITAFLDLPRRVEMMQMLRELARTTGRAILLSTHDLDLALRSADSIWLLPKDGAMQVGAPEDLVLNGSFSLAFAGEGIEFDKLVGSFRVTKQPTRHIELIGEGIEHLWAQRALERAGFRVTEHGQPSHVRVEVIASGEGALYQLTQGDETRNHETLGALIGALKPHRRRFDEALPGEVEANLQSD